MPNVENILRVADAIEQHSIPDLGFNMAVVNSMTSGALPDMSGRNCGTVACVAGWIHHVFKTDITVTTASDVLGISEGDAKSLFLPEGYTENAIGPDQAVRTLRHLAATGEVDWAIQSDLKPA